MSDGLTSLLMDCLRSISKEEIQTVLGIGTVMGTTSDRRMVILAKSDETELAKSDEIEPVSDREMGILFFVAS